MSAKLGYLAIGAGAVGLGIAGAVAFLMPRSASVSTPTAHVAAPAPPVQASASGAPPPRSPANVPATEFEEAAAILVVASSSAAYVAPSGDAPQLYPLKVGTPIQAIEKSKDNKWQVALTEDGQAVFVPTADLGPYSPPLPDDVRGQAKVIDTATLVVGIQKLALAGVTGEGGDYAQQLQALINAKGGTLHCQRQASKYTCDLPGVGDIARVALFNGAARPGPDARDDYRQQADAAQSAHKGIWK